MTFVPLKLRLGLFAAALAVATVAVCAAIMVPFVYRHELTLLDKRLTLRAGELWAHLESYEGGAALLPGFTGTATVIPVAMRNFYIQLDGPDGIERWRTANLGRHDLGSSPAPFQTCEFLRNKVRVGTFPHNGFTLRIGADLRDLQTMQNELRTGTWVLLPLLVLASALSGWLLGHHALRPVAEITAAAERITAEHLSQRLPVPPARDDIARLTRVLNETFERLERSFEQAYRFSADASHQLKTPVTVLRADLDALMKSEHLDTQDRDIVSGMLSQTRRLTDVIEDLLLLALADSGRLTLRAESLDIVPLIEASLDDLSLAVMEAKLEARLDLPPQLIARADRRRLGHLLQNLADNAAKYNQPGGQIRVTARKEAGQAIITIANTGAPIPAESQPHIFERFHRAEKAEEIAGHGLGLNIAQELARAHGGTLRLVRSDPDWTEFELCLPADP